MSTLIAQKGTLDRHLPADHGPPLTMSFLSPSGFKGDMYYLGIGGVNFTSNLVGKAQSLTLSPGLAAYIYPQCYPIFCYLRALIWLGIFRAFVPKRVPMEASFRALSGMTSGTHWPREMPSEMSAHCSRR